MMPAPVALPGEVALIGGAQRLAAYLCDADRNRLACGIGGNLRSKTYLKRVTKPRPRGRPGTAAYRHREDR